MKIDLVKMLGVFKDVYYGNKKGVFPEYDVWLCHKGLVAAGLMPTVKPDEEPEKVSVHALSKNPKKQGFKKVELWADDFDELHLGSSDKPVNICSATEAVLRNSFKSPKGDLTLWVRID